MFPSSFVVEKIRNGSPRTGSGRWGGLGTGEWVIVLFFTSG